ncbi:hypothetical protein [Fulvivirga ligni]|uniref:hypothetical protein n=1 Tax=Fulvivirga ligni TaxID=2904246 RepID=UPI001F262166|nr:hypothetical protein [Fulvivirga ligni]UII23450.1 hypothetical protein LVD16_09445 [Fulvivirga ligni]
MTNHYDLSDAQFEEAFSNCSLNPSVFNHEAHLRLAWIHIRNYGIEVALLTIPTQLKAYVKHLGAEDKYNATLTHAAVKAVYHFMLKSYFADFQAFIEGFPRLKTSFKDLMAAHYGFDIYNSAEARKEFLEPDLLPFD